MSTLGAGWPAMEYREIEVTVLSAQDLKDVSLLGRSMSPYAEVWIYSSKKEQTGVCSGGGRNPSWNCGLKLACEERLFRSGGEISIAVYNRGSFSFHTLIGTVAVPLPDLVALCHAADDSQSSTSTAMSCPIRTKSGKTQGVLNLAVKVGAMVKQAEHRYKAPAAEDDTAPVVGYPAAGPYPRRLLAVLDQKKEQQYYPPGYHPRYGQPAALYQQAPLLKVQMWPNPEGPHGRGGAGSDGGVSGGGCGGGCGG